MRGSPIYFSKKQLAAFWFAIFGFLTLTALSAFAQAPNLQIDPSAQQPPLCRWVTYASPRVQWGGSHYEMCYQYSGRPIKTIGSTVVAQYGGVPASGYRPSYCYLNQDMLAPVELGSRGSAICPPLDAAVQFTASEERISDGGKFTINWSAWTAKSCILSGKAPETGTFSQNFSGLSTYIEGSRTYDFVKRGVYNFQFKCNGYIDNSKSTAQGDITRNITIYVGNIPPPPKVDIKIEPATIKKGESATLSWTSENAIAVSINQNVGVVGKTGSIKVKPSVTTRYAITGSGEFAELGLARASVSLRVVAPDAVKVETAPEIVVPEDVPVEIKEEVKPEVGLTVNGRKGSLTVSIPANLSINWKADQYCIAYGSWLGVKTKATTETRTLTKTGNYSYKLYCPGIGTEEVKVVAVGGTGGVSLPVAEAGISLDGKNFAKSVRVTKGEKTHLWLTAGKDVTGDRRASRDDAGGWSTLMSAGGRCDWNYDLNRGVPVFDVGIADPKSAADCSVDLGEVTFYDEPGVYAYGVLRLVQSDGKVSAVSSVNIAVEPPPPPDTPPVISLKANGKENELLLGAPAVYDITWDVKNADTCEASGSWTGSRFLSGTQRFVSSEKKDFNYVLTCVGKLGTTVKNLAVKVAELPVCDFSALPILLEKSSVFDRQSVLTWKCQFANTCSISPSIGASVGTFGTARVSPIQTTTYSLTCENLEGSSSFDQLIEVR